MNAVHERDLDLNLLPVLLAVSDTGSVTAAAQKLYVTQSAVSAALKRLESALDVALIARHGRGVVLTERGTRLVAEIRPHLDAMLQAALTPRVFDPRTSDRIVRLGLSDAGEEWLLPPLLQQLTVSAPRLRLICTPIQFRTLPDALATRRVDVAVTVADELSPSVLRKTLLRPRFVCLFDPRFVRLGARPTERAYLSQKHVLVSYNGDLRGIIEDYFGRDRDVCCSVGTFSGIGAIVDGSRLVATVPDFVARATRRQRPHLQVAPLPFRLNEGSVELIWPEATDTDDACKHVREAIVGVAKGLEKTE